MVHDLRPLVELSAGWTSTSARRSEGTGVLMIATNAVRTAVRGPLSTRAHVVALRALRGAWSVMCVFCVLYGV
eukprot:11845727-Alexandrium_andersonii.AAC.1